ncbi:uncharacterized protein LOC128250475 [Octopus bimaculoides]|uniref:uncharacterized protein LOC128250475 n=1 Tax=Octopus bimaculoides TaxID=37653 RepID=UPI0022E27955|nr:uncharacterized protein LOC128250475 [Octopus bimaculoides]
MQIKFTSIFFLCDLVPNDPWPHTGLWTQRLGTNGSAVFELTLPTDVEDNSLARKYSVSILKTFVLPLPSTSPGRGFLVVSARGRKPKDFTEENDERGKEKMIKKERERKREGRLCSKFCDT